MSRGRKKRSPRKSRGASAAHLVGDLRTCRELLMCPLGMGLRAALAEQTARLGRRGMLERENQELQSF